MIKSLMTVAPVRDPADKTLKMSLSVGVDLQKTAEGITASAPGKGAILVPWSNVAFLTLDTALETPIVTKSEERRVEMQTEAGPIVSATLLTVEPPKVKKGPFGRPLKP